LIHEALYSLFNVRKTGLDDLPTGQDALDFKPYVDALSDILLDPHTRTPLTLGVFGSWGSGKTSLMTMLRQRVAGSPEATASPSHRTVWFNAWKYNQEGALWRALLLLLLDDLAQLLQNDPPPPVEGGPSPGELLDLLRQALYHETTWTEKGDLRLDRGQALSGGAALALNLILSGAGLGLAKVAVEEAKKAFGKGEAVSQASKLWGALRREELSHYQAQLRSLEQFQRNFELLVKTLLRREGRKPRRLVVFVDDLDRCLPEKAIQVLEAIKLFLDVKGCMFVLGLDAKAIENAVRTRYRGEVKPREYLEKIIQLPFILPLIEAGPMRRYVQSLAPALPNPRCAEVFSQGLAPNPRQVKRTLNIFLLLSRLVERREALAGITPLRLAKFVAIQHAHPELYDLLRVRPGYLPELEAFFRREAGRERGAEGEAPRLPEALEPFRGQETLRQLLCLFDQVEARFDALKPLEVRSYVTLARQATPSEAPAVALARLPFEPEMVAVVVGPFFMGTSEAQVEDMLARFEWARELQKKGWFAREQPQHEQMLPAFEIGRYPVTNAEYAAFVAAAGHAAPHYWSGGRPPDELSDHPVVNVTWRDALAYVAWLRERTGQPYRLPTEAEWEKAARGEDGRLWPWGDDWDVAYANCRPTGPGRTTPVGQYSPAGDSPCGCADMAGNVWEWCSSLWGNDPDQPSFAYPYRAGDGRENLKSGGGRILRGGAWNSRNPGIVRCAYRDRSVPDRRIDYVGFRVARGSPG
jgi:formylglycine-generating enzyme required for sulfatase activity